MSETYIRSPNGAEFPTNRISDPHIHRNIRKFHASVTAADPRLHEICLPSSRSHVTLDTLNIDDGAEESVLDAMRKAVTSAEQGLNSKQIQINAKTVSVSRHNSPFVQSQIGHDVTDGIQSNQPAQQDGEFTIGIRGTEIAADGSSVFAKVAEGRGRLDHLREGIRKELKKMNLVNGGFARKPFDPHVTLLKSRHQGETSSTIDPMWFADVADLDFGVQRCRSLQLLSMTGGGRGRPSDDGGYYTKLGRIILGRENDEASVDQHQPGRNGDNRSGNGRI